MGIRVVRTSAFAAALGLVLALGSACENRISATPLAQVDCLDADECFAIGAAAEDEPALPDAAKNDKYARAAAHFDAACELDHAAACMRGAMIYWLGPSPLAQDLAKSVAMMERSCELEYPEGCSRLGDIYENGWGVKPSPARALELYKQACEGGYRIACSEAKRLGG